MGHSWVMVVCPVDRYWRSGGSLCPYLDLVISAIPLDNLTLMALNVTMKFLHAYNIDRVLGGWPCVTPRSWWFAESIDICGVTGHSVLIWNLVISAIPLNNFSLMALATTMKFRHAYNIVRVLDGCPRATPRSWWLAEWTDIGGVTGHYVLILDLVISAFAPHNPNIMAITITMKFRHAYNFVRVLGG
jgi:hypothetical protein